MVSLVFFSWVGGFWFLSFFFSSEMVIMDLVKFPTHPPPQQHPLSPRKGWSAVTASEFATQNHEYETAVQVKL